MFRSLAIKYGTNKWEVKVLKCNYSEVWLKVCEIRKPFSRRPIVRVLTEGVGAARPCPMMPCVGEGTEVLSLNNEKGGFRQ